jgi:hypothetical protein
MVSVRCTRGGSCTGPTPSFVFLIDSRPSTFPSVPHSPLSRSEPGIARPRHIGKFSRPSSSRTSMHLGRRLIGLSLNVLLILSWTGRGAECAPSDHHAHGAHGQGMAAMHGPASGSPISIVSTPHAMHPDCSGEMVGAGCGLMDGCATASLATPLSTLVARHVGSQRVLSGAVASLPLAAPQPPPPPPRA